MACQEGSDSEQESNDGVGISRKPKRARGKPQPNMNRGSDKQFADVSHSQSVASSYGCLSLLKKRRSGGKFPFLQSCLSSYLFKSIGILIHP